MLIHITLLCIIFQYCSGLKMISTDPKATLPARTGQAEIMNSSLDGVENFTICARFKSYKFNSYEDAEPYNGLISLADHYILASYVALPCDHKERLQLFIIIFIFIIILLKVILELKRLGNCLKIYT